MTSPASLAAILAGDTLAAWVAPLSPLTYAADLLCGGLGELRFFPAWVDAVALAAFAVGFLALARLMHRRRDQVL